MSKPGDSNGSIKLGTSSHGRSEQNKADQKKSKNKRKQSDPTRHVPLNPETPEDIFPNPEATASQWKDPLVHQLQSILIYKIHTIFNTAIHRLVELDYEETAVINAITRIGFYRGGKDIAQNIVNDALLVLESGTECMDDIEFESLTEMVEYTMVEMVLVLVQVKPSLTIAEAMWWFLLFDMDIVQACGVKGDLLAELKGTGFTSSTSTDDRNSSPSTLKSGSFADKVNHLKSLTTKGNETSDQFQQPKTVAAILEETVASKGRKPLNKKELETLQKVFGDQINLSDNKTIVGSGLVGGGDDKKLKSPAKSLGVQKKGSKSKSKSRMEATSLKIKEKGSTTTTQSSSSKPEATASKSTAPNTADFCVGIPIDATTGKYIPRDSKDEIILKLLARKEKLQKEMEDWTDWANLKVMEATTRLSKDKAELTALKQEKELTQQLKKEKKMFEENARKRVSDLQFSMVNANCQAELTNDTIAKLKEEQTKLWDGMQMAKMKAVESQMNAEEALEKEGKTLKEVQSWNGKLSLLQEELKTHKKEAVELQQELSVAEKVHSRIQEKLKETITEKEEVLKQVADMKKGKEKSEAAFIEKEEKMKEKVKTDMKKYEEAIEFLNKELSQMTVESEGSLIADLRRGMSGSSGVKHKGESSRKRERECVMCLSEERSVIFIPCAHEVLCVGCNEAHKNQGMRDCPSCRAPIVMRLKVRFSHE